MSRGNLILLVARKDGAPVGGVLGIKWKTTFALEYTGDNGQFRKQGIVQLMYWEAVKRAVEEGHEVFSFGRTFRGNHGLMRSKSHWGAERHELCTYFYPETTHKDAEDRQTSGPYRLIKTLSGRLPLPAYQWLGEFCYRHMG